jgi:hypothetical protein
LKIHQASEEYDLNQTLKKLENKPAGHDMVINEHISSTIEIIGKKCSIQF